MTLDEFKIGKNVLFCKEERICVDKGSRGVTLSWDIHDPENTDCWFAVAMSELDDCVPVKSNESDPAEEFNVAKKVLLDGVVRIEFRLEDIMKAIGEIRLETAYIKRSLK